MNHVQVRTLLSRAEHFPHLGQNEECVSRDISIQLRTLDVASHNVFCLNFVSAPLVLSLWNTLYVRNNYDAFWCIRIST